MITKHENTFLIGQFFFMKKCLFFSRMHQLLIGWCWSVRHFLAGEPGARRQGHPCEEDEGDPSPVLQVRLRVPQGR